MASSWILFGRGRKARSRRRNSGRQGRNGVGGRQLRLESLEVRSLLSAVPGLQAVEAAASSLHGPVGPTASAATELVFLEPRSVPVGAAVPVALEAVNARGLVVPTFSDSVQVTSSDKAATLPGSISFVKGVATFSVTFNTIGSETLIATDTANAALDATATANVVNPAVATQLLLVRPLPRSVPAGVSLTVQLAALNALGNVVQGFSDTVAVTSSDTAAVLPSSISFVKGVATFSVTFNSAGPQTLTATDTTNTAIPVAKAATNVVNPAVATQLVLVRPLPRNVPAGVPLTVELAALNAQGKVVQGFSDTVTVTSSDKAATLPGSVAFVDGVATFAVTFNTAGPQTLTATDTTNTAIPVATAATNVVDPVVATKATQLSLALPSSAQIGVAVTVQLTALNAQGQVVQGFSDSIQLASSDKAVTLPGSISFVGGVATFSVTFNTTGSQTLTATDTTNTAIPVAKATTSVGTSSTTPNPTPTTSSNWSGYAAETNLNQPQSGSVSAVTGSWNVPAVTGSGTAYSAVWVGIDGYQSSSVEQIGTESDVVGGHAEYSVWYEMYPAGSMTIKTMSVSPGDSISASVQYLTSGTNSGKFELTITDTSQKNDSFTTYQSASGAQRSSAEWIIEAPSSNSGVLPLADFGSVTFTGATATINGVTGPIDGSGWQETAINMVDRSATETSTSALTDANGASSFTETDLTSNSTNSNAARTAATSSAAIRTSLLSRVTPKHDVVESVAASVKAAQAATDEVFASLDLFLLEHGLV